MRGQNWTDSGTWQSSQTWFKRVKLSFSWDDLFTQLFEVAFRMILSHIQNMLSSAFFQKHCLCSIVPVYEVCNSSGDFLSHGLSKDVLEPNQVKEFCPTAVYRTLCLVVDFTSMNYCLCCSVIFIWICSRPFWQVLVFHTIQFCLRR